MKITAIEPISIGIPYKHDAPKTSHGSGAVREVMDAVYLKVETDAGITGWGEVFAFGNCPLMHAASELVVKKLAVGLQIDDIPAVMADLYRRTQGMSGKGPVRNALSGLDIALWDIKGKAEGKPIWKLLGGSGSRQRIPTYASLLRTGKAEYVVRLCHSALERGYKSIKIHERNDEAIESVAKARETVGSRIDLMLDTNCAWLPNQVIEKVKALAPYNIKWVEEPVYPPDDFKMLARIRKETGVPVAAGENLGTVQELERMLEAGAVDYVQPDVAKFGGICEMMKATDMAMRYGVPLMPHSPIYGPGLIATLHIASAMKVDPTCEYFYCDLEQSPMGDWAIPKNGHLHVPDGPGLGVDVDKDVIASYRLA
jgi:L-alanine-DL-glutamate epimerase-like enolase superfamily enzyme